MAKSIGNSGVSAVHTGDSSRVWVAAGPALLGNCTVFR
jgi:hypothetical protein